MKKTVSLVLCLVMMLAVLLPAQAEITGKGEFPIVDEPYTLRVAMPVSSKVEDINTNKLTLWMEEQSGIDLEFIELSESDTATQVNMMMNGGDLPDVILAYSFPYDVLCSYADAGLIQPIEEYIDQYAVNVFDTIVGEVGDAAFGNVSYDGHIWAMPSAGAVITNLYCYAPYRYQHDILDVLNMEVPTTLDEFYDYLVAVRDTDVNGNGNTTDEIPMTGFAEYAPCIYQAILNAYQYTDHSTFLKVNEDGKVEFTANNELFKEGVSFVKKLVDEKLLDPAAFTQDASVLSNIIAQEGNHIGVYAVGTGLSPLFDTTSAEYNSVIMGDYLTGPYGYRSSIRSNIPIWRAMVVTSACERPDIAVRFFDMLLSDEAAVAVRVGFEGEQWRKADEGVIGRDGQQAWFSLLTAQEWVQPSTNVIWDTECFIHDNIMNHCEASFGEQLYPNAIYIQEYDFPGEVTGEQLPSLLFNAEDQAEYSELKNLIVGSVKENIALFALGDRSLDEFDAYCQELENMGLAQYIEMTQNAYDSLMGK